MWLSWKLVTGIDWMNKIKNHKLNNPHIHKIYVGYLKMRCCGFYQNVPYQIILVKFSDMHIDLLNPNIPRLCQNCNVVEDEIHFVMDCNMTINISEIRIRLDNITADYNNFEKLDKISQFKYSFSTENTLHFAWPGKCLHTCLRKCILVLRCAMFRFSTMIFYRGVPGFATDCRSGVSCRGLITYLLYVGPLFENLVWNDSGFVWLHNGEKPFHCFDYVFTYILMPHNMVKLYLICLLFMAQIVLYCLHGTLVRSFTWT